MKYFRAYPWMMQLMLFFMMIITMMGCGSFLVIKFLPVLTNYTAVQIETINEHSPSALVNAAIIVQGLLSVFIFMVPAWVFSYLATPRPAAYIGLRAPGKKIQLLLAITLMLGIMPVLQLIEGLISQINFSPAIKAQQAASESMMNAFLTMPSFGAFVKTFIIVAIVPAVGEEFFFRGVLLRFARKPSRNMVGPVIFTAVVFSLTHANIYGYLSIFIAGVVLAMIYYFTGSLWCSILAHLFFNGSQVVLSYMSTNNASVKAFLSNTSVPFWYVAAGLAVFVGSYYLLLKNKTPLPDDWTNDFLPEELEPTTE